jgi:hypothetical protein
MVRAVIMGRERKNSPIIIARGVKRRSRKPKIEPLERRIYPKSPTITVGSPIRVLMIIIRKDLPLKFREAMINPVGIPTKEARNVAMRETFKDSSTIL